MKQLEEIELELKLQRIDKALGSNPNNPVLLKERLEVIAKLVGWKR